MFSISQRAKDRVSGLEKARRKMIKEERLSSERVMPCAGRIRDSRTQSLGRVLIRHNVIIIFK